VSIEALCDALTQRALDTLDARSWLLRLSLDYDSAHDRRLAEPAVPVVDDEGDPVVMALLWRTPEGEPRFVAEFDAGEQRFRAYDARSALWTGVPEGIFCSLLHSAHLNGVFDEPDGPMDTQGDAPTEGSVGITVIRGDTVIPVDLDVGLAAEVGDVGEEAERFLREQTRGD